MDKFINVTNDGNEKAIRKGKRVPDDAVNLAWVNSPGLNPEENLSIIDTSSMYSENSIDSFEEKKIMYANAMGVLEDIHGNQLIDDEFPVVSDVFSIDEDYSLTPVVREEDSEYKKHHILGFVHKSRHFHIDYAGLCLGSSLQTIETEAIKIVNSKGEDYVDKDGNPRYRIQITPGYATIPGADSETLYRVYAFVDTALNEDLYLKYNMVELDAEGNIRNQRADFTEILNPRKYFRYTPEESEVIDPSNRHKKQYSTQTVNKKEELIGEPVQSVDGYKVYVPKKAIPDPRHFQLFRWRVGCRYTDTHTVDPIRTPQIIKAGVITSKWSANSSTPYVFYNLNRSEYNPAGIRFINPLKSSADGTPPSDSEMKKREYWQVNIDEVSREDLHKFDILIWSVKSPNFSMEPYAAKVLDFAGNSGGSIFVDSGNIGRILNWGVTPGMPVSSATGASTVTPVPAGLENKYAQGRTMYPVPTDYIVNAEKNLGGWDIYDYDGTAETYTISPYRLMPQHGGIGMGYLQKIISWKGNHWDPVVVAKDESNNTTRILMRCKAGTGNMYYSTMGLIHNINQLWHTNLLRRLSYNDGPTIDPTYEADYHRWIRGHFVEGAYKLMYNIALMAVRGKHLDSSDEEEHSTSWESFSKWQASWVIDPREEVLSPSEINAYDFVLQEENRDGTGELIYKRKLSAKNLGQLVHENLSSADRLKVQGATKEYFIEVTNPNVLTDPEDQLTASSIPYAWTNEYSPPFTVPPELGPYIIKQDNVVGDYTAGSYVHKSYPPKPYHIQASASGYVTQQHHIPKNGLYKATAKLKVSITTGSSSTESILNWREDGLFGESVSDRPHEKGLVVPQTLVTWQDGNYYNSMFGEGNLNWPYWGMNSRLVPGSRGNDVAFLHDALNRTLKNPELRLTGDEYGSLTQAAVLQFQVAFGAKFKDGIVDAETWFLLGNQVMRRWNEISAALSSDPSLSRFAPMYEKANRYIAKRNISDGATRDGFIKTSSPYDSPPIIWEMIKMQFDDVYRIHAIEITPWTVGAADSIMFRSVDVRTGHVPFRNYNSRTGKLIYMNHRPKRDRPFKLPVGPYTGDTVILGIGQDRGSGVGKARSLGVKDIQVYAKGSKGNGKTEIIEVNHAIEVPYTVPATGSYNFQLKHQYTGPGKVIGIEWLTLNPTFEHPNFPGDDTYNLVEAQIRDPFTGAARLTSGRVDNQSEFLVTLGPEIGPGTINQPNTQPVYSMNEHRVQSSHPETGWISKSDGIKLLCNRDKTPWGFPVLQEAIGKHEEQNHYVDLRIDKLVSDPSLILGFYDIQEKEFIRNSAGEAQVSYLEYLRRKPQNIYIGLVSDFTEFTQEPYPEPTENSAKIPYRWAMPVYGLTFRKGSTIQIEKPSKELDAYDLWSLPIRTGRFTRKIRIPKQSEKPIAGKYKAYQGATLEAHYEIAEANDVAWSLIHGRPFRDILDETPIILDERTIQVRQAPIHAVDAPTQNPGPADPTRPVFKVFKRASLGAEWEEIPLYEIRDYNLSTGVIELRSSLPSLSEELIKVSYTTDKPVYHYKGSKESPLILNPYLTESYGLLETPIYIGLVPRFVRNLTPQDFDNEQLIEESVTNETLMWTTDLGSKLDPLSEDYDPFFVQLGIVYVSPNASLENLSIIDSRRRGGGAKTRVTLDELQKSVSESKYYWDISHGTDMSYQTGGFVIIRLPVGLKDYFSREEISAIIRKNLTAGVEFKIEDLDGNPWEL